MTVANLTNTNAVANLFLQILTSLRFYKGTMHFYKGDVNHSTKAQCTSTKAMLIKTGEAPRHIPPAAKLSLPPGPPSSSSPHIFSVTVSSTLLSCRTNL